MAFLLLCVSRLAFTTFPPDLQQLFRAVINASGKSFERIATLTT
jgi:hypothetical protein